MSLEKKCSSVLKKLSDLEKMALGFEKDEAVEIFSCKRCIKQNDMAKAATKARRCIELRKKIQVYYDICHRVRIVIDYVKHVSHKKKAKVELVPLVYSIEEGLNSLNFGLIELYLENFEKNVANDEMKELMRSKQTCSYIDVFKVVPQNEVELFLCVMAKELETDGKQFLFKKSVLDKDFIFKTTSQENKL